MLFFNPNICQSDVTSNNLFDAKIKDIKTVLVNDSLKKAGRGFLTLTLDSFLRH